MSDSHKGASSVTKSVAKPTHQPLDYSKWDKVDWEKPEPPPPDLRKRPTATGPPRVPEGDEGPQGALRAILEVLLPQVLGPFAVKKLEGGGGRGFLMLKCSHRLEEYIPPPPKPELCREFSVRYIVSEEAEGFLKRMGADAVLDTVKGYMEGYEPREELVLVVASKTETGKGCFSLSLSLCAIAASV